MALIVIVVYSDASVGCFHEFFEGLIGGDLDGGAVERMEVGLGKIDFWRECDVIEVVGDERQVLFAGW